MAESSAPCGAKAARGHSEVDRVGGSGNVEEI